MRLEISPIELDDEADTEGRLILHEGRLAAVLSHLSEQHPERAGRWFLECGFGSLARCEIEFDTLDAAKAWIEQRLNGADGASTIPG